MDRRPHIPATHSAHYGAHICSKDCKFVWQRSRLQCQKTGLQHICDYRCLAPVSGEGNLVCLWTGRVCTHSGTSVDNRYENNLPRSGDGETEGSRYGVRSLGYGPPNAIKHASAARERSLRQLPVWGGAPLLPDLNTSNAPSVTYERTKHAEQTPRWGGPKNRRRTAKRRSKTEVTATVTKTNRKPTSGLSASPAVRAKQRCVARKLSSNIFFNAEVRKKARAISLEKIKHLYVKTLKRYVEACEAKQHTPLCVTEVVAVYACCASSVPLPIDIVYNKKKQPETPRVRKDVMQSHVPAVKDTEDLQVALTNFLVDGWQKFSATAMWMDAAPDFGCYVLGMIYLCSAGGLDVAGINVIPALPFFMIHTPDPSFLTQLCAHMGQKDCRSSEFGRARITIGMNSIKSALQHEQKHGNCDLSHFVVEAPTLLAESYEDAEKESIWHIDNIV